MPDYTILLIDYDPRSIDSLRTPLRDAGYKVEVAKDGVAGVTAFDRLKPDLTLVEAMIPKKHGFEVCQELKATEHGSTHPVLIITGVYKGRKYRNEALHRYRCDRYLEKPLSGADLVSIVDTLLYGSPRDRPAPVKDAPPPVKPAAAPEVAAAASPAAAHPSGPSADEIGDQAETEVIDLDAMDDATLEITSAVDSLLGTADDARPGRGRPKSKE